jgi:head-tail adaptor
MLNRRLVLEAPVESADSAGGVIRGFAAIATLWVSVTHDRCACDRGRASRRESHPSLHLRFSDDITTRTAFAMARIYRIVTIRDATAASASRIEAKERVD